MEVSKLINSLKNQYDVDPYSYDGSYELMSAIITAYSHLEDYSMCNYKDLNAIYGMALASWTLNVEKKKAYVLSTHLLESDKQKLIQLLDTVWDKACMGKYLHKESKKNVPTFGMFGTGFYSFENKTTDTCVQDFIKMCIEVSKNSDSAFDICEKVLTKDFKGMGAASASIILHCLKPNKFPVINANMGNGNIFTTLGIHLNKPNSLENYIDNCKKIEQFNNTYYQVNNYRVYDLAAQETDENEPLEIIEELKTIHNDKNMILYGPPGTGKTYNTAIYAVAICDNEEFDVVKSRDYSEIIKRYDELKEEGRIEFTTFHQSYGYEEFIEGIKPVMDEESKDIGYTIDAGIFKKFCEDAKTPIGKDIKRDANIWFIRLDSDIVAKGKEYCFERNTVALNAPKPDSWTEERFIDSMEVGDFVLSYAGNSVYIDAIGIVESDVRYEPTALRDVKWYKLPERVDVKSMNGNHSLPKFSIAKINHMKLYDLLDLLPSEFDVNNRAHVFIIDEINRGNISKIFGELITLIEDTKREGMAEQSSAILPYSHEEFSVPKNVYILGTMNTADRSIALMDTALRRRFRFIEMMPDVNVLEGIEVEGLKMSQMLAVMNTRIEYLYDREHTIGHAFFTKLKEDPSIETLAGIFEKDIIPLLQEYFYEDYEKIQMVLGDNDPKKTSKFITSANTVAKDIFKGDVEDLDLPDKKYEINKEAFLNIDSYKGII